MFWHLDLSAGKSKASRLSWQINNNVGIAAWRGVDVINNGGAVERRQHNAREQACSA